MNDYIGKICPFCKTEFKPDDEIVICDMCEMPHHKECWIENKGCTTFGCHGTIKSADNFTESTEMNDIKYNAQPGNAIYCTKCGAENLSTSSFCSKCGNSLRTNVQSDNGRYTNINNIDPYAYVGYQGNIDNRNSDFSAYHNVKIDMVLQELIGEKKDYYIPEFQRIKMNNKKMSWNWGAFLVAPYWMIYRKMYAYGACILGINLILYLISFAVGVLLSLCGYVVIGIYGNYIYMNYLEKKAEMIKAMNEPYKTNFILQNRGINSTATILSAIGYILVIMLILF